MTTVFFDNVDITSRCPSELMNTSYIVCDLPPGEGRSIAGSFINVQVQLGQGQSVARSAAIPVSYDPPVITGVSALTIPSAGAVVSVLGRNFGPETGYIAEHSLVMVLHGVVNTTTVPLTYSLWSHTLIQCTIPPGIVEDIEIIATISGQAASSVLLPMAYATPTITSILPGVIPTEGGTTITIGTSRKCCPLRRNHAREAHVSVHVP